MGCGASNAAVTALPPRPASASSSSPSTHQHHQQQRAPAAGASDDAEGQLRAEIALLAAENARLQSMTADAIVIDRAAPLEAKVAKLMLELRVLQPYGPPTSAGDAANPNNSNNNNAAIADMGVPDRPQTAAFRLHKELIDRLEGELDAAHAEAAALRQQLDRAAQHARVASARTRADALLLVAELKERNAALEAQRDELARRLAAEQEQQQSQLEQNLQQKPGSDDDAADQDPRARLIAGLSAQLMELSAELDEAHATIAQLQGGGGCGGGADF